MHRVIFEWGPLTFYWYGLMLAVAFLVGLELLMHEGRRRGLDDEKLFNMTILIMIGSLAGARLLYVATHWGDFSGQPRAIFEIWQGGLTKYGGVGIGVIVALVYARRGSLPIRNVFDAASPSLAVGAAVTRVGCFLNGCCFGKPTALPWGVVFPEGAFSDFVFPGAHIHPTQVYSGLVEALIFLALWLMRKRVQTAGLLFASYLVMEGVGRALLDQVRYYDPSDTIVVLGRTTPVSQVISVGVVVLGVGLLALWRKGGEGRGRKAPLERHR